MYLLRINKCFFMLAFFSFMTSANMTIYPMAVGLDTKGEGSVRLLSKTNDVQFVKTKTLKITNPGTPEEKEVDVNSYSGNELVVMPPKFAIPGGSSKLVRFVAMNVPEKEEIYRVMFQAVPSLDDDHVSENGKAIDTEVSVNLVWGILVSIPPLHPRIDVALSPDHHFLHNNGTQRIKIINIGLCKHGGKDKECVWKEDNHNLFPEKEYNLPDTAGYEKLVIKYKDWIRKTNNERLEFSLK
ncbi:fimbria/pilus periplasmic chaperone [Rahnella aquatilis]|uniref:fimbria/pilus periplasmic chaperone n=1 Tax=Rahnella aquatilis TaxID=34038 RepID=UPI000646BF2C|nr:fimbria/pilus periplasmic chaperone [Rahnella aquatilis]